MSIFATLQQNYGPWLLSENFISAQYLVKEAMKLDRILCNHSPGPALGWDCFASVFTNLQQSYGTWLSSKFCFCSISCE